LHFHVVQIQIGPNDVTTERRVLSLHQTRRDADLAAEFTARAFAAFKPAEIPKAWQVKDKTGRRYRIFAEPVPF
jgi:hypothetical protein